MELNDKKVEDFNENKDIIWWVRCLIIFLEEVLLGIWSCYWWIDGILMERNSEWFGSLIWGIRF